MASSLTTFSGPRSRDRPDLLADAIKFAGSPDEQGALSDGVGGQAALAERVAGQLRERLAGLQDGADAVLGLKVQFTVGMDRRGGVTSAAQALVPEFLTAFGIETGG